MANKQSNQAKREKQMTSNTMIDKVQPSSVVPISADATTALIQVLERAASNPDVDLDKMERLFSMRERILANQAEQEFNAAMARAQARIGRVAADANNPQTRSKYSSYAAIDREIRPHYSAEGFAMSFDVEPHQLPDWVNVVAYLTHSGGHTRRYTQPMPADGKGAKGGDVMTKTHAVGSAKTYGMRYLAKGIWNIATGDDPDDDDGNAAGYGAVGTISDEQAQELADLADEVGANVPAFLKYLGVKTIMDLPAHKFGTAKLALERKRQKGGAA
jgi:hypothetical protein